MKKLKIELLSIALLAAAFFAPSAKAQVRVGVGIGVPVVAVPVAPACAYGYYDYEPYACAPYGYYGADWFVGGVFIGAGPWYGGHYNAHYVRGFGYHGPHEGFNHAYADHVGGGGFHGGGEMHGGFGGGHGGGGHR